MKSKKLKLPLWQEITYLVFVGLCPIVITCMELFNSHSTVFKWSFASVGAILLTIIVLRRFVLKDKIDRVQQEVVMLEHDYSISVGDEQLTKNRWRILNMFLYLYNAIVVILSLILCQLFVTALADGLIAFKGASILILCSVLLGTIFKVICYYSYGKKEVEKSDGETESK